MVAKTTIAKLVFAGMALLVAAQGYAQTELRNTFFKEADAAKVLLSQGADVLTQHTDSTAAMQIAEEQGDADVMSRATDGTCESGLDKGEDLGLDREEAGFAKKDDAGQCDDLTAHHQQARQAT